MAKKKNNTFKDFKKNLKSSQIRYNKVSLETLKDAVTNHKQIDISNKETLKDASQIIIIKRNGSKAPFNKKKLEKVVLWATGSEILMKELIADTEIKLHKEIKITEMYQQLILTAVNKISMLQPQWENIAAKLQLLSYYKETYNISETFDIKKGKIYPSLEEVLKKGIEHKIYDKKYLQMLSEDELKKLDQAIDYERDFIFNYKALVTIFEKYCMNYTKTKKLELPQHAYMRVAIALMIEEDNRVEKIIDFYNNLSLHLQTVATPIILNAMTPNQQLSSCVLNTVNDDSHSILDTGKNLGIYSKFKGGTALDVTSLRAGGSYIEGTQGYSSGPTAFMQYYERIMKAWNQGGKRPGALAIYFSWWHLDVETYLSLKSNGGTDENRARGLKYACKLNQIFVDAVLNDDDIYIFDPKDAPNLIGKFGAEFNFLYKYYSEKKSVRKKKIRARDLADKLFKERSETGNVYLFHEENVNNATLLNRYIGSSNLCCEIVLPSRASLAISEELIKKEDGNYELIKKYQPGEIALCNLSSVNLERWFYLSDLEKNNLINTLVRALDNTIDLANYPVKEGKLSNTLYRYLGIGVLNLANYLALYETIIDSENALEITDALFDDLSYRIINASADLAIEKGKFEKFYETQWAEGILPIDKAHKNALDLTTYTHDKEKWDKLREKIKTTGLRNAQLMAIAPTATSGKSINAIESTEPIHDFFYKEEGTITIPTIVPNFRKNNQFYKKSFDCNQYSLLKNAAVRQKWLDQAQSINVYLKKPDSLWEMTNLHFYGFSLGLKTFYYLKQQKNSDAEEVCESCS
jgi:ribonucleoside-diphosphate reductase alpha chain